MTGDDIAPRCYEESIGIVLMRTTVSAFGVLYEVVTQAGVVSSEIVKSGKRRSNRSGGSAFVAAARRQERAAFECERQAREQRRSWLERPAEVER